MMRHDDREHRSMPHRHLEEEVPADETYGSREMTELHKRARGRLEGNWLKTTARDGWTDGRRALHRCTAFPEYQRWFASNLFYPEPIDLPLFPHLLVPLLLFFIIFYIDLFDYLVGMDLSRHSGWIPNEGRGS